MLSAYVGCLTHHPRLQSARPRPGARWCKGTIEHADIEIHIDRLGLLAKRRERIAHHAIDPLRVNLIDCHDIDSRIVRDAENYQLATPGRQLHSGLDEAELDEAFAQAFSWTMLSTEALDS